MPPDLMACLLVLDVTRCHDDRLDKLVAARVHSAMILTAWSRRGRLRRRIQPAIVRVLYLVVRLTRRLRRLENFTPARGTWILGSERLHPWTSRHCRHAIDAHLIASIAAGRWSLWKHTIFSVIAGTFAATMLRRATLLATDFVPSYLSSLPLVNSPG